jgi:hypothetical protein
MSMGKRRQQFVDREVQGAVLLRVLAYWIAWVLTTALAAELLCWCGCFGPIAAGDGREFWRYLAPAGMAAVMLLPVALLDAVKLSNKLVGSLLRLRRDMRQLAGGHAVAPLRGRGDDFWRDCDNEFNALRARVAQLESERQAAQQPAPHEHLPA